MKTKLFTILVVTVLLGAANVPAYPNWDIYNDTDIYDGNYGLINIYDTPPDHTTVNMYGGSADFISTYDASTFNVMGGSSDIEALDFSVINVSGGDIGYIKAWSYATVNFFDNDGSTSLGAEDFANIYVKGGNIGNLHAHQSGVIYVYAGYMSGHAGAASSITADDFSAINIYGHDLFKTSSGGTYGYGQVSGFLMDDTYICVDLYNPEAYLHVNLIPEPATFILFGIGSLILLRKKNSENNRRYS